MLQMIFEVRGCALVPSLPRNEGGVIVPDGDKYLSLAQAATFGRTTEAELRDIWTSHWSGIVKGEELEEVTKLAGAPAATAFAATQTARPGDQWQAKFDVLRLTKYARFADEHFAEFLSRAEEYKLNPLCEQICADLEHDELTELPRVKVILQIAGFRLIAHRTGEYAGCDEARFEYGESARIPLKATFTVYRRPAGVTARDPYTASVLWEEFYPPEPEPGTIVAEKPHVCLETRAEAAALRRAFPAELGGLFISGETQRLTKGPRRRGGPVPASFIDEFSPKSWDSFVKDLDRLGFDSAGIRKLVRDFENRHPLLKEQNPLEFYATVMHAVSADPAAYGAYSDAALSPA